MKAHQLKNAILQLAVQGKLVPQNPNDEPASKLLERIAAEKRRRIKAGEIKKDKRDSTIVRRGASFYEIANTTERCIDDELPFDLPNGWEWARLAEPCDIINGFTPLKTNSNYWNNGTIPWFTVDDIHKQGRRIKATQKYITEQSLCKNSNRILPINTVLICCTASVGEYAITEIPLTTNQQFNGLVIKDEYKDLISPEFLYKLVQTFKSRLINIAGKTTINFVSVKKLGNLLIPIPPLAEQHRIVDRLESLLPLVEAYGKAEAELSELDARFPDMLKKSILQDAVQGKLVPQNPNDEPASVLLERIRAEKQRLIKEGKIKKDKHESVIFRRDNSHYEKLDGVERCIDDELPFDLPNGWEWCRVGDLFSNMSGLAYKKDALAIKTDKMIRVLRGGNIGEEHFLFKGDDVFISSELVKPELYLRKNYMITPAVSSLDHIGKIALIDKDYSDTVVGGFVLMLIPHFNNDVVSQYLLYAFAAKHHRDNCRNITHKSGQAFYNLSREQMMNLPVPIPPLTEQRRIVQRIEELLPLIKGL